MVGSKAQREAAARDAIDFRRDQGPLPGTAGVEELDGRHLPGVDGRPLRRTVDTLDALRIRRSITGAQFAAGKLFQNDFIEAAYEAVCAAPLEKVSRSHSERTPTDKMVHFRRKVEKALKALGGQTSLAGSIVLHVVGLGMTITDYCIQESLTRRKTLNPMRITGRLEIALDILAEHYDRPRRPPIRRSGEKLQLDARSFATYSPANEAPNADTD